MFGVWFAENDGRAEALGAELSAGANGGFFCTIADEQKFPDDCLCEENERYIVRCEGCILNSVSLAAEQGGSLFAAVIRLYESGGAELLCRTLKGAYALAIFDRHTGRLTVTNDLLSKRQVFYYDGGDMLCWSTSFFEVCNAVKKLGCTLTADPVSVSMMLHYRYMLEDYTYAREISYLKAFRYLTALEGKTCVTDLPVPPTEQPVSKEEACARLDELFMNATRLQYAKNAQYGYAQIASLSGGMDSKAVFLCGMRAGYAADRAFTYAEPGSLDETIPQAIAADYGIPHIFHSIARGNFIKNREEMISGGEGFAYYAGTTGLCGTAASMRTDDAGIIHAGIGGGEIMGDVNVVLSGKEAHRQRFDTFVASLELDSENAGALTAKLTARYDSWNAFININDLRQCVNLIRTSQRWFVPFSPFLDEEFFCYAMGIPVAMRAGRSLYCEWCTEYMSNPYVSTSDFITSREVRQRGVKLRRLWHRVTRRLSTMTGKRSRRDMNPFNYWDKTNPELRTAMDDMLAGDLAAIGSRHSHVISGLEQRYSSGGIIDRLCVLTVTWALARM